ncbi:hypothetical protein RDWZM_001883 [Blomia tropicalis]|uniref:K Homology domain-containing protein n=1 Tax=Blomia tropicalis TaxID=40697 RepID=A0A9Q0MBJ8_BLOTA|nr:hypothetical protein RDWZM_001883 [Blomia tropicalis]
MSERGGQNQMRPQKGQIYLNGIIYNGEKTLDFMIPGNKVGFVIGKGGEMIRTLQDKAGVRMVFNQDSNEPTAHEKPLRISGPPDKVDYAKQLVVDLLTEKDMEASNRQRNNNSGARMPTNNLNEYGSSSRITFFEYPVSPTMIGLVIGKGGETIRKIQADSGCKVQFDTTKLDAQGNKICQFTGTQEAVSKALELVKEIIETVTGGSQGSVEEIRLIVPTSRTGTVIGRGGETIRALKQQSGCNIELDKNFHSDNDEKCFILRGTADKVTYAQQLVTDKVGGNVTVMSSTIQGSYSSPDSPFGGYMQSQIYQNATGQAPSAQYYWPQAAGGSKSSQDQYAMWAAYYAQYYQTGSEPQPGGAPGSAAAANTAGYDESIYKQWAEYYRSYGMTNEAEQMELKLKEMQSSKKKSDDGGKNNGHSNGNSE